MFKRVSEQFTAMFRRKAFLHWWALSSFVHHVCVCVRVYARPSKQLIKCRAAHCPAVVSLGVARYSLNLAV
jgi:hypothetical protein